MIHRPSPIGSSTVSFKISMLSFERDMLAIWVRYDTVSLFGNRKYTFMVIRNFLPPWYPPIMTSTLTNQSCLSNALGDIDLGICTNMVQLFYLPILLLTLLDGSHYQQSISSALPQRPKKGMNDQSATINVD